MGAFEIRSARSEDAAALGEIDRATWSDTTSPAPPPASSRPFFDERAKLENVLVALVDGRAAGYVELGRATDLAANDHVVDVKGLAVDPVHQGRGIGHALVQAAAEEAARRGARRLTLRVLSHNDIARALYERSGFVVEGVLRGEFLIGGEYVDDVLMARALDEEEPVPPDAAVS